MKKLLLALGILISIGAIFLLTYQLTREEKAKKPEIVAKEWIKQNSPTYKFDGSNLRWRATRSSIEKCVSCFITVWYTFESSHAGYGDRTGQMLAQVITPHRMELKIKDNKVVAAVTDEKFDEITGEMATKMFIRAYFGNNKLNVVNECNEVHSIEREVEREGEKDNKIVQIARAALRELLKGPTDKEKEEGYFTSINSNVTINKLTVENGSIKLDFSENLNRGVAGSCRVTAIRTQIEQTIRQSLTEKGFRDIKEIVISINGRTEDVLQP